MPSCTSCGAELTSDWKFCIYCGTTLAAASAVPAVVTAAVPGAIRQEDATADAPRTRLDIPLLIGIVLGLAGAALLVYMGIVFFGPG